MYRIGLTGGIASGKSTVAAILKEHGLAIISADQIAHEILQPGESAYRQVVARFGPAILLPDGQIDRRQLAEIVFNDALARQQLNEVTHPEVLRRMDRQLADLAQTDYQLPVVLEIPLLIEAGLQQLVDEIWLVVLPPEVQLARLMARNQLDRPAALARMAAQLPPAAKLPWASEVIDNGGSWQETREQVSSSLQQAISRSRQVTW